MFAKKFRISNFNLTQNSKSLIIAEIGINHEGNFEKSLKMINKAKLSGADLVKLQFADVDTDYDKNTESYKLFKKSSISKEDIYNIYKYAKQKNIKIFTTFSKKNLEFFKKLNQCCYKISSSLFYDFYFIKNVLKLKKPVIVSTGVADIKDIDLLINLVRQLKFKNMSLLHCRSLYPTKFSKLNLSRISYLINKYRIITGFSDHSKGIEAPVASIHYGAKIIEKHFTLDEKKAGYDHHISLNPMNFKKMVDRIRLNEKMIGNFDFRLNAEKKDFLAIKKVARAFVINKDIKKNKILNQDDFDLRRTISKKNFVSFHKILPKIIKRKIKKNLKAGTILKLNNFN